MKIEINVPEVVAIFKEIQESPEKIFQMVRLDVREMVGKYLSEMMNGELTHFLGREPYERRDPGEGERESGNYPLRDCSCCPMRKAVLSAFMAITT